jgi:uncharacterized membrane protein YcaP (DUF421 family)
MDMVMTVVFGSTLSRGINGSASLASCLAASLTLVVLQRIFAQWSCRSERFSLLAKGRSELLVKDGHIDEEALRKHALTREDLEGDIRTNGLVDDISNIRVATLERSGQISVVAKKES